MNQGEDKTAAISRDPHIQDGQPVLAGTRFRIAQMIAEIADRDSVSAVASDFCLDIDLVRRALNELALEITNAR